MYKILKTRTQTFAIAISFFVFLSGGCAPKAMTSEGDRKPACKLIEVYVREGCPFCAMAKGYLTTLQSHRPDLTVNLYDVRQSQENMTAFHKVSADHHVEHPGVPTFLICGEVIVGFSETETPPVIEALIGE